MDEGERRHPSAPPDTRVGQTFKGKWYVDRLIDVGGMATVYAATHRNGRRAAIKVLHARFARDPEVRRRFLREGYVANKIDHPGAVAILDDDVTDDGAPFLVMELLEGESLSAWLARAGGRLPVLDVLAVGEQLLEVLEVAHANGIVHRDVKPGNILVTPSGHAKLLDFGLARIRDGVASLVPTAAGLVLGTAGYLAPEQARGAPDEIDARSDLFALGAVLFRALSGRPVHDKPTHFDAILAAMKDPAPPFATVMPAAGPLLIGAIDRALAFDRAQRFQSAREMAVALRVAYEEARRRPPPLPVRGPAAPPTPGHGDAASLLEEIEAPSLIVEIAFGDQHDESLERERRRTRDVRDQIEVVSRDALDRE
ncbi:MAG TPA: serine/threonine-protein kinase [Polyangiaceae bacterium]|nr:serine/threonine-protein kinase [Polyangiaceae bacterium]